tara:strand:+ start:380 stop:781 length:402 start_codon:yes stop_codon:yes gene_type:complete
MTESEKMFDKFVLGLGGRRYREVFDLLESNGLRALGKSNTETLLYQFRNAEGKVFDVFAFRMGPPPVISFPKSYWLSRRNELGEYLENFSFSEKPAITGVVSDSQYSAGQIEMNRNTQERVVEVCTRVCVSLP